jgi:hypothetical protein
MPTHVNSARIAGVSACASSHIFAQVLFLHVDIFQALGLNCTPRGSQHRPLNRLVVNYRKYAM